MSPTDAPSKSAGLQALGWDDLQVILAICRTQSLSGAARSLTVNHSTVARRINAIEDRTGVRFFDRLPTGYIMTQAGEAAMEHAEKIDAEVQALEFKVLGRDMALSGPVRVTCPEGIAISVIPPMLVDFVKEHPGVTLELIGTSAPLDMHKRETEVAIRATARPPEAAYGRKICDFRIALYSSRDYLDRVGDLPVADHDWCLLTGTAGWLVPLIWARKEEGEARAVIQCLSPYPLIDAVAQGMGTTMMPCYLGDPDERLIRISEPLVPLYLSLWALTHDELRRTARVRALMTHLTGELRALSDLFVGKTIGDRLDVRFHQST